MERHHVVEELRGEHCPDTESPENPYDGGGGEVGVGLLVALLGSGFVYWGTR